MKREGMEYAMMLAIVCLAIVGAVVIMTSLASADDSQVELPEPEYISADAMVLSRAEAPERANSGLATYETFEEALERTKAAVPDELAELAGRAIWGEAGGIPDEAQRAAVVWCACNRADAWDMEIGEVLTVDQFHGLAIRGTVPEQHVELARDVLARWTLEAEGWQDVGRVLPSQYLYFEGDGRVNHFSTKYGGGEYWDGVESRWGNG